MEKDALFSSAYLAPVQYYAHLLAAHEAHIECYDNYVKQTYRNRCLIAGAEGTQALTIPVVKPENGKQLMRDLRISDHGNWRHLHWNALRSAYNKTPFFEYYADDFAPFYERKWEFLFDFNTDLQQMVCSLLDIDTPTAPTTRYEPHPQGISDYRETIQPRSCHLTDTSFTPIHYYQLFEQRHGFLPNLSIVDLLFNMGPEGLLILQRSIKA